MPPQAMDYSKCVIYKIQHKDKDDLLYVGHTTNMRNRKYQHKNNVKCDEKQSKIYRMIRDNGGWDEFNMIIVKEFPCENIQQALIEEDKIMREMKANLNTQRAIRNENEYEEIKQEYYRTFNLKNPNRGTKYYHQNKEKIKERNSKVCVCVCGKEYSHQHKLRHERTQFHQKFLNETEPVVLAE